MSERGNVSLNIGGIWYSGKDYAECYRQADDDEARREHLLDQREQKRDRMKYANVPKGRRHK